MFMGISAATACLMSILLLAPVVRVMSIIRDLWARVGGPSHPSWDDCEDRNRCYLHSFVGARDAGNRIWLSAT